MRSYNIVVLGMGGAGKSAICARFAKDMFIENYNPTIEEEFVYTFNVDGVPSQLEILDTAGAEQFISLNEVYIKAGMGFLLVFSLTQETSLREVDSLRQQIYRIKSTESVPIVVVGTKLDLVNEREVQRSAITALAAQWSLPFYETSAKRNWNVQSVFEDLVKQMSQIPEPARKNKKKKHPCVVM